MKFNLSLPNNQQVAAITYPWMRKLGGPEFQRILATADELGYHKVTVGEHLAIPHNHVADSGTHYMQATTILGYLAACTPRMRVGSNITLLALQNPIVQAKMWAVLDWVSGGRADINIGVGWLKEEFDILGVDFRKRGRIVDEYVEAMIEIWTNTSASYHGEFVSFEGVGSDPKPTQKPYPPLWFAGDAPAVMERVARWGSGWSPYQTPLERFPEQIDRITSSRHYQGRPIEIYYNLLNLELGLNHVAKTSEHNLSGWNADCIAERIHWLGELGVTEVSAPLTKTDSIEEYLDRLRWVAEEVFPLVG
ncbi:TIGR03619 family F420-dependent LLM class oxidoreductase [Streptomyces mexicanus]|uniref:TIGR03619 family F420-dependent LLM class oxidoreductase n=1 Tax=Streptomyces mexicanus TaxID=178566 RepID=A0A7X1HYE9_9ACTN|nr:TIGR03619 family F420-dependent LLM class oxidoreductase [Streptomyces mexicanus]MBC2864950.1 TIGR03619 family F420-dependent LLM class oxidoreductase [Streptomyces mexicanus]